MDTSRRALRRVEDDLARGHTHVAVQRLSTVVMEDPTDLEVRALLASVRLQTGNLVEAGRWSFVLEGADPRAVSAFERAFPNPRTRLEQVRWHNGRDSNLGPEGRDRMARLRAEPPVPRTGSRTHHGQLLTRTTRWRPRVADAVFPVTVLLILGLAVIGAVSVVRWII